MFWDFRTSSKAGLYMEVDVYETNYFTLVLDDLKSCDYLVKNYSMCPVMK